MSFSLSLRTNAGKFWRGWGRKGDRSKHVGAGWLGVQAQWTEHASLRAFHVSLTCSVSPTPNLGMIFRKGRSWWKFNIGIHYVQANLVQSSPVFLSLLFVGILPSILARYTIQGHRVVGFPEDMLLKWQSYPGTPDLTVGFEGTPVQSLLCLTQSN